MALMFSKDRAIRDVIIALVVFGSFGTRPKEEGEAEEEEEEAFPNNAAAAAAAEGTDGRCVEEENIPEVDVGEYWLERSIDDRTLVVATLLSVDKVADKDEEDDGAIESRVLSHEGDGWVEEDDDREPGDRWLYSEEGELDRFLSVLETASSEVGLVVYKYEVGGAYDLGLGRDEQDVGPNMRMH